MNLEDLILKNPTSSKHSLHMANVHEALVQPHVLRFELCQSLASASHAFVKLACSIGIWVKTQSQVLETSAEFQANRTRCWL